MMRTLATLVVSFAIVCSAWAQPSGGLADWKDRLEALSPDDPLAYFELGEELAAAGEDADDRDLLATARRLFVLAFELGRRQGDTGLSASASIAIASLSALERERRWLRALAATVDPRHAVPDWSRVDQGAPTPRTALRAAEAIGHVRTGNGRAATALLQDPGVRSALSRHDRLLHPFGARGGLTDLEREARLWPCPECRNTRLGRDVRGRAAYCGTCEGRPGPELTPERFTAHLRTEFALLNAEHANWSSQLATDGGSPLRDPDPEELASAMRIDPARTLYREGRWVRPQSETPDAEPEQGSEQSSPQRGSENSPRTGREAETSR